MQIHLWVREQGANSFRRFVWIDEQHPLSQGETCLCREAIRGAADAPKRLAVPWYLGHTIPSVPREELFLFWSNQEAANAVSAK